MEHHDTTCIVPRHCYNERMTYRIIKSDTRMGNYIWHDSCYEEMEFTNPFLELERQRVDIDDRTDEPAVPNPFTQTNIDKYYSNVDFTATHLANAIDVPNPVRTRGIKPGIDTVFASVMNKSDVIQAMAMLTIWMAVTDRCVERLSCPIDKNFCRAL